MPYSNKLPVNTPVNSFCYQLFPFCVLVLITYITSLSLFLDLAKDSKMLDINEVINLDASKLKVEETGKRIVRKIQDWLATESSSKQVASLPEDTTRCLLVGLSIFSF